MNSSTHKNCLICNSSLLKPLRGYESKYLQKCKNCGFVFIYKIPTKEELDTYYATYAYSGDDYISEITIKRYNELLDSFEPFRQTNKLLDIGCGRGYFLEVAKKRGWQVYGTEYSQKAIEICINKGFSMNQGKLNENNYSLEEFDIITSFEVIEHINNPLEEISIIKKLLRKEGLFYCTTPNFNSLSRYYLKAEYNIICYPEHLSYYTKNTLKYLLNNNGFTLKKIETTGISFARIQSSITHKNSDLVGAKSIDEKVRSKFEKNFFMKFLKASINKLLSLTNTGSALKGYFVKK